MHMGQSTSAPSLGGHQMYGIFLWLMRLIEESGCLDCQKKIVRMLAWCIARAVEAPVVIAHLWRHVVEKQCREPDIQP